jgi:hypothetical protein
MNIRVISGVILLFLATSGYAQDTTVQDAKASTHSIGVTIGVNQVKEANLLPRVHTGFVTTLSYGCTRSQQNYTDFQFLLGYSRIIARSEDITKSANVMIGTSYSYAFKVLEDQSLTYFLGPEVKLSYSAGAYPNWDDSHLYWANYLSAGINNVLIYAFQNETQLVSHVSIPLLSLFSRPDLVRLNKFDDLSFSGLIKSLHSNMTLGFWNMAFYLHIDLEYHFPVFRTKQEAFFYSLEYVRLRGSDGNPYTQLIHQVGIKVLL